MSSYTVSKLHKMYCKSSNNLVNSNFVFVHRDKMYLRFDKMTFWCIFFVKRNWYCTL